MRALIFTLCIFFIPFLGLAQKKDSLYVQARVNAGDTLMMKQLDEVVVHPRFRYAYQNRRYNRLILYVKKVYPYAQIAAKKMREYEQLLQNTPDPKEQRKIMKRVEAEIYAEWGDDLKELTYRQGEILLKLIDRQTGNSSYAIVQEFRGNFRAFFYQSFARLFGFNLKERYNPKEKVYDRQIENIVRLIDAKRL
jgi:hypothetical protein